MFRFAVLVGLSVASILLEGRVACAQARDTNYDEDKVPKYTLPDPLVASSGEKISSAEAWRNRRRPELLHLFETQVYGKAPGKPPEMSFELTSSDPKALGGKATRKEVTIRLSSRK